MFLQLLLTHVNWRELARCKTRKFRVKSHLHSIRRVDEPAGFHSAECFVLCQNLSWKENAIPFRTPSKTLQKVFFSIHTHTYIYFFWPHMGQCLHDMKHPQVSNEGDDQHIWKVRANILTKLCFTAEKRRSPSSEAGWRIAAYCRKLPTWLHSAFDFSNSFFFGGGGEGLRTEKWT